MSKHYLKKQINKKNNRRQNKLHTNRQRAKNPT